MGTDYNKFKSDVRALEVDLQRSKENKGKTKCNVATKKKEESETKQTLDKVLTVISQINENERIDKLEGKTDQNAQQQPSGAQGFTPYSCGGRKGVRHFRGQGRTETQSRPFRGHGRGRSSYVPQRPVASSTFRPSGDRCYRCNQAGHFACSCPLNH